jgi:cysteine desulfurase
MKSTYLDHAATSPMAPEALRHLIALHEEGVANSSSAHLLGTKAAALLTNAREKIAAKLGSSSNEVVFCSGGTEANNWVLQRTLEDWRKSNRQSEQRPHLLTLSTEHSSVANTAQWLKEAGVCDWNEIKVDREGYVDLAHLSASIRKNTALVSISHGNNEIGTIQDLSTIGEICRKANVLFHADACQSFCHTPFSVRDLPVDLMTLSGHKVRGPKGIGALFIRQDLELTPLIFGGKQERGLRPGTTSVELISSFAVATGTWNTDVVTRMYEIRSFAVEMLKRRFPNVELNGPVKSLSLCHILSFTIPGVHSKVLHRELANRGIACSTGAACGTGKSESSAVLLALGHGADRAHQIRLSFSPTTEKADIEYAIEQVSEIKNSFR